ncbi:MAG: TrkA family potassium uptake protein [Leptospiraceae bacterium]|nr:TrkA family potassium uptake protein [Leptospiraceae bacterium]MDW8307374.1 TrkA family potassium uptake protein [Leptospiraceae bacterium]
MGSLRRKIVVIGLGEFGRCLVPYLHREGHEVMAIDINMERVEAVKDECTLAVCVDCTDEKAMRELDLENFDTAIIAISVNFETLLVAADILKKLAIPTIIARYRTELQKRILAMLGITEIFNPEEKAAQSMAEMFRHEGVKESFFVGENFRIIEVKCPEGLLGLKVKDLHLEEEYQIRLISIRRTLEGRKERRIVGIVSPETTFREDDELLLFGQAKDLDRFLDALS